MESPVSNSVAFFQSYKLMTVGRGNEWDAIQNKIELQIWNSVVKQICSVQNCPGLESEIDRLTALRHILERRSSNSMRLNRRAL